MSSPEYPPHPAKMPKFTNGTQIKSNRTSVKVWVQVEGSQQKELKSAQNECERERTKGKEGTEPGEREGGRHIKRQSEREKQRVSTLSLTICWVFIA